MSTALQIHLPTAGGIQTLAAQHGPAGTWLLSTFAAAGAPEHTEVHIPASAGAWLAGVAGAMVAGTAIPQMASPADVGLADRIRAIAASPSPAAIAELLRITAEVARIERALDEIAADALESAMLDVAHAGAARLARAHRAERRRGRLVVVK